MSSDSFLIVFFGGLLVSCYVILFKSKYESDIKKLRDEVTKEKQNCVSLHNSNISLKEQISEIGYTLSYTQSSYNKSKDEISILKTTIQTLQNALLQCEKSKEDYLIKHQEDLEIFLSAQKGIMPYISGMIADYMTMEYDYASRALLDKKRPAVKEAQRIDELRMKTRNMLAEYKVYEYQLKYLLELYPELDDVLEAEFSEIATIGYTEHDPIRDWLTDEEWRSFPETKKNQMALDRYIAKRKKSNWQIGRDYELYIGQHYENLGYSVEYYGMDKKLEDLGRDLIAKKDNKTLIIQCKCWSKHKQIHENAITQLFGTLTAYRAEHDESLFNIIEGVLVTTIELSETAKKFAKLLNITVIENIPMQEFPRIKCNIGKNGEKIYHLPMDQQYDKVKIDKPGECYAFTVDEAEQKGFRRAFRYNSRT